jgi:hypothetical protein
MRTINHLNLRLYMNQLMYVVLYLATADRICPQPLLILSSGLSSGPNGRLGKKLPSSSLSMFSYSWIFSISEWKYHWLFFNSMLMPSNTLIKSCYYCSNWGTETDPEFKGYHNGNSDPRGFGMCKESSYVTLLLLLLLKLTMNLLAAVTLVYIFLFIQAI